MIKLDNFGEVLALVGVSENHVLEFKRDFDGPLEKKDAKKDIVKEVVAFSNAHGGTIIFGIAEEKNSSDQPAVAKQVIGIQSPYPKARQVEQIIKDNIEPRNPFVSVAVLEDGGGLGVIVINVHRAPRAPVMSLIDNAVYRRGGTISQKMSMWEIQDMVLERANEITRFIRTLNITTSALSRDVRLGAFSIGENISSDLTIPNSLALFFVVAPLAKHQCEIDRSLVEQAAYGHYELASTGGRIAPSRYGIHDLGSTDFERRSILGGVEWIRFERDVRIQLSRVRFYRDGRIEGFYVFPTIRHHVSKIPVFYLELVLDFVAANVAMLRQLSNHEMLAHTFAIRHGLVARNDIKPLIDDRRASPYHISGGTVLLGDIEYGPHIDFVQLFNQAARDAQDALHLNLEPLSIRFSG